MTFAWIKHESVCLNNPNLCVLFTGSLVDFLKTQEGGNLPINTLIDMASQARKSPFSLAVILLQHSLTTFYPFPHSFTSPLCVMCVDRMQARVVMRPHNCRHGCVCVCGRERAFMINVGLDGEAWMKLHLLLIRIKGWTSSEKFSINRVEAGPAETRKSGYKRQSIHLNLLLSVRSPSWQNNNWFVCLLDLSSLKTGTKGRTKFKQVRVIKILASLMLNWAKSQISK